MAEMAELFARDPLKHTDEDIKEIIAKFRASRLTFKSTGTAQKEAAAPKVKLDLGSLTLGAKLE